MSEQLGTKPVDSDQMRGVIDMGKMILEAARANYLKQIPASDGPLVERAAVSVALQAIVQACKELDFDPQAAYEGLAMGVGATIADGGDMELVSVRLMVFTPALGESINSVLATYFVPPDTTKQ